MKIVTKTIDVNAHITNITCKIGVDNDFSKALVSFDNLGFGVITAIKFNAKGFNSFGDVVQLGEKEKFYLIIQDIKIEKNTSARNLKVNLPTSDIRKLELEECQICYADGSLLTYVGPNNRELDIEQFDTVGSEKETLDSIRDVVSSKAKSIPQEIEGGWLCSCERYNSQNLDVCSNCGVKKSDIFKITDPAIISDIIAHHKNNEFVRQEKAKQEIKAKEKAARRKKIKIGIGIVLGIILAVIISRVVVLSGRSTYSSEAEMKTALQGTYTYYNSFGTASRQIVIDGDTAIYKWGYSDSADMDIHITKWDYKNGKIKTFESLIVTSQGYLKDGNDVYKKGGHMSTLDDNNSPSSSYENGYSVLKITLDSVSSNSVYAVCTGSVKNNGKKTYKFVEVKGAFKDSNGNVIDTDWTYAAGSEGLEPGESATFRLSVPKNSKISSCSVRILDFD